MGVLGWPPEVFWSSTLHDLTAALSGFSEKNGAKSGNGLTDQDCDELQDMLDEALRAEGRL